MGLGDWLQVHIALSVEDDVGNLRVQFIDRRFQPLLKLLSYEGAATGPLLQDFSHQVVSEPFILQVQQLLLVIISIENYTHLDCFDVLLEDGVLTDRELFNAEVLLQGSADLGTTNLVDGAIK